MLLYSLFDKQLLSCPTDLHNSITISHLFGIPNIILSLAIGQHDNYAIEIETCNALLAFVNNGVHRDGIARQQVSLHP